MPARVWLPPCRLHHGRVAEAGKSASGEFLEVAATILGLDHAAQRCIDGCLLGPRAEDGSYPLNQLHAVDMNPRFATVLTAVLGRGSGP
jgi:hypothetical protein